MRHLLCVAALCCFWFPLKGIVVEESASANALGGITMLSHSVSDYALSPIIGRTGISFSYHRPFSIEDTTVYGIHNAVNFGSIVVSTGMNYLQHSDIRSQDNYLGFSLNLSNFALGYTQHLHYAKISTNDSYYEWDADVALSLWKKQYATEIRYVRMGSIDPQLHLGASTEVAPGISFAGSYVYAPHGDSSYRAASSYKVANLITFQSSWQSEPPRLGFGVKFTLGYAELMYAVRTHPELNLSHGIDLGLRW
ncbi:MAG: hypothetical protein Q8M98_03650 [Candidatus Cloacimonadaceae bacterium]|nr:hypothetical protein [Candidatus Cloacimonadaceae bacterium]MDP3113851.1 hypothetical protein [Candidatus Cloacimonadaceae bacterium]